MDFEAELEKMPEDEDELLKKKVDDIFDKGIVVDRKYQETVFQLIKNIEQFHVQERIR